MEVRMRLLFAMVIRFNKSSDIVALTAHLAHGTEKPVARR
jgi:hypothetical protein